MDIVVLMKMVPDPVEEIEIDSTGRKLDGTSLRLVPMESDEHALEQALLVKEGLEASVTVIALEMPGADDVLWTALAKGATKALRITPGYPYETLSTRQLASIYSKILPTLPCDLLLTGAQAIDDVDGELGALLSARMGLPYLSMAVGVRPIAGAQRVEVVKELGGGHQSVYESPLPVIVGVQAAEKPPRYVSPLRVLRVKKSQKIESAAAPASAYDGKIDVLKLYKPTVAKRAAMLSGNPEEIADRLRQIFDEKGLLGG